MIQVNLERIKIQVLSDINVERDQQDKQWGIQRHDYGTWLKILVEEVGEVAQAMQIDMYCAKESDANNLYKELIQVSAVAAAIAEQVKEEQWISSKDV